LTYSWTINGHSDASYADHGFGPSPDVGQLTITWQELQAIGVSSVGTYDVALTVDDGLGHVVTSSVITLTVSPMADAGGPYCISFGHDLWLNGANSQDPDGDPLTYSWTINGVSDPSYGDQGFGPSPYVGQLTISWQELQAIGAGAVGTYQVALTVDDGHGHVSTGPVTTLTVNPNQAPVADAGGPYVTTYGDALSLDSSATNDPDNDNLTYTWTINGHVGAATDAYPIHSSGRSGSISALIPLA
jgi:hypothetical protein